MSDNFGSWSIDKELFDCIRKLIPDGSTILELGSGSSTGELSKYYKMISIEHDKEYIGKYDSEYIYAPFKKNKGHRHFTEFTTWYDPEPIRQALSGRKYDLMLVDGPPGSNTLRPGMYRYRELFNWDIPVIFDDSNNHLLWRLIVQIQRWLKRDSSITLNGDKRKCFTVLADPDTLRKLL